MQQEEPASQILSAQRRGSDAPRAMRRRAGKTTRPHLWGPGPRDGPGRQAGVQQHHLDPATFAVTKSEALAIDLSTWVSAAKLITAPWPGITDASGGASQMSPRAKVNRSWSAGGSRLARLPT